MAQSSTPQHPKLTLIGAGSLFFGRQAIWQMVHSPLLNQGTLALVDINPQRLEQMARLARMVIADSAASSGVKLAVEASTDRKDVLDGSDFVVLSFANQSVKYRGLDCEIAAKYGIRMCSGDSTGPGGIFRTLRELPAILDMARDVRALCPQAWLINYVNPTAAQGIGLRRYAPDVKSFALCDGLHMPYVKQRYALQAGIVADADAYTADVARRFDLRIAGVNHFTWILKAAYEGQDMIPALAAAMRLDAEAEAGRVGAGSKEIFNATIGVALYEAFGIVPACVAHTKEYVRFWQGLGKTAEPVPPLSLWQTAPRYKLHEQMWQQVDDFTSGRRPISDFMKIFGPDHATDVIEAMVGGLPKPFYINTFNAGSVTNMADDAFLELLCDVDMSGPRPRPVGAMPRGVRGLQEQVLDAHELAAAAAATCDRAMLRRAMLTDPLVSSIGDADAIIRELLEAEREALPAGWFA